MVLTESNLRAILTAMRIDDIDITKEAWEQVKARILFIAEAFFRGDD